MSLTLSHIDILKLTVEQDILAVLRGRRDSEIGLERLVIQQCRLRWKKQDTLGFDELVEEVEWNDVDEMRPSDEDTDEDESDYSRYEYDPLYYF